mmetsp:Transcript_6531/g.11489  ORF Transcript_6531/g.11489 Transcript_6531/m.11489 type:complete len:90 (+) Transcript_6531:2194-2463(+)
MNNVCDGYRYVILEAQEDGEELRLIKKNQEDLMCCAKLSTPLAFLLATMSAFSLTQEASSTVKTDTVSVEYQTSCRSRPQYRMQHFFQA